MELVTGVVIDASILIGAASPDEKGHTEALDFLKIVHERKVPVHVPIQFMFEIYASLNRRPRDLKAFNFLTEKNALDVTWRQIDERQLSRMLGWLNERCQGACPTRGGDLSYLVVSIEDKLPLVTSDPGMLRFRDFGADVWHPGEMRRRIRGDV